MARTHIMIRVIEIIGTHNWECCCFPVWCCAHPQSVMEMRENIIMVLKLKAEQTARWRWKSVSGQVGCHVRVDKLILLDFFTIQLQFNSVFNHVLFCNWIPTQPLNVRMSYSTCLPVNISCEKIFESSHKIGWFSSWNVIFHARCGPLLD